MRAGTPNGRPVGVKNYGTSLTLTELYRELSPLVFGDLMERYKAGDENARDFLLPRLWPESPKFSAYIHQMAEREQQQQKTLDEMLADRLEEWRCRTEVETLERVAVDEFERKCAVMGCYLPDWMLALFLYPGAKDNGDDISGLIKAFSHIVSVEDLEGVFLPDLFALSCEDVTKFAVSLLYGSFMEPDAVRSALTIARFPERLIEVILDEVCSFGLNKMRDSLFGQTRVSIMIPCLRSHMEDAELLTYLRANHMTKETEHQAGADGCT